MGGGASTAKIESKIVVVGEEKGQQNKPSAKYKAPIVTNSQDKNLEKGSEKRIINDGNINVVDSPDAKIANNKLKRLVSCPKIKLYIILGILTIRS